MYAPIIIFVYNRADRVKSLLSSLEANPECSESDLFIFSDGAKNEASQSKVDEVRAYIDSIPKKSIFNAIHITKSEKNKGLARSIIDGVSHVMELYGKAIIIEDDNVVAPDFLDYMNRGLDYYEKDEKIWAISGFSRKMPFPNSYQKDVFALQRISSYAWASWKDRWDKTEWDIEKYYPKFLWNRKERKAFDALGQDRSLMLDAQMCGKVNSSAIRFEYSMFKQNMYSVFPCVSRVSCNGNDGSGTHSTKEIHDFDTVLSDGNSKVYFAEVDQQEDIRKEFVRPYRKKWKRRILGNSDFIFKYYFKNNR